MKISTTDSAYKSSMKADKAFTMKATGHAFKIITKNLYTDPALAVLRELGCNARDSHVANGNANEPFEVFLPDHVSQHIRIRDYGTGMSHEDILEVYTTYFSSTKTDNNDMIGGFGLGSKTPFILSDSFMVTSIHNGMKHQYIAMLDKEGVPGIKHIGSTQTDERSGMEITIPTTMSAYMLKEKAINVYKWFDVPPYINGEQIESVINNDMLNECGWFPIKWNSGVVAVIGGVPYSLGIGRSKLNFLTEDSIAIRVPIGELTLSPSRDTLSFDDATNEKIEEIAEQLLLKLEKKKEEIYKNKNFYERAKLLMKYGLNTNGSIEYKNTHAERTYKIYPKNNYCNYLTLLSGRFVLCGPGTKYHMSYARNRPDCIVMHVLDEELYARLKGAPEATQEDINAARQVNKKKTDDTEIWDVNSRQYKESVLKDFTWFYLPRGSDAENAYREMTVAGFQNPRFVNKATKKKLEKLGYPVADITDVDFSKRMPNILTHIASSCSSREDFVVRVAQIAGINLDSTYNNKFKTVVDRAIGHVIPDGFDYAGKFRILIPAKAYDAVNKRYYNIIHNALKESIKEHPILIFAFTSKDTIMQTILDNLDVQIKIGELK